MVDATLSRLPGPLYVDLGKGNHRNSVFLAGSGRSGTTWLSGIIVRGGGYRYVFEPFNPGKVRAFERFGSKQYLRPGDEREEFLGPARLALAGWLRSPWADRFNGKFFARRRLIKDIRANLLLGWMHAHFPGMPIILLLRHPCAVVASRLALGWKDNLSETMQQEELVEDFLPMQAEILGANDDFERHLFLWCIDNHVPLRQFGPGEIHLVFYENLLVDPVQELRRLFDFLGDDPDAHAFRELARPSPLSQKDVLPSLDGWRGRVAPRRLRRVREILALFGLDRIYDEETMPDPSGANALMKRK